MNCPHCLKKINKKELRSFTESFIYGDGDGEGFGAGSEFHGHNDVLIWEVCPYCDTTFYVEMYIPMYVQGEPCDVFDHMSFLGYRELPEDSERDLIQEFKAWKELFDEDYSFPPTDIFEDVINAKTLKEAYKGIKRKYRKFVAWIWELKQYPSCHADYNPRGKK